VHVQRGPAPDGPVLARIEATRFNELLDPESFPQPLPIGDAYLAALAYAEQRGIACVWVDDPDGFFPPKERPIVA
jgi:hypothetical protein